MTKRTASQAAAGAALPAAAAAPVQTPAPHATADWPPDQYTGIGGDYVRDPATGVRTPAPTYQAGPAPVQPTAPAAGDTAAA